MGSEPSVSKSARRVYISPASPMTNIVEALALSASDTKAPRSGPSMLWEKSLGRPVSANRISCPSVERK